MVSSGADWWTEASRGETAGAARLYRALMEQVPVGLVLGTLPGQFEWANPAAESLIGRPVSDLIGQPVRDLFFHPETVPWEQWCRDPAQPDEPSILYLRAADGRLLVTACRGRPVRLPGGDEDPGGVHVQVVVEDITTQHRRLHELQVLHDLTQLISAGEDVQDALQSLSERLVGDLGYRVVGLAMLTSDGQFLEGRALTADAAGRQDFMTRWGLNEGITGRAIRENRSFLVRDVAADPDYYRLDPAISSEVVAVIRSGGVPVGVLDIECDATHPLDEADLALAESIAVHLGVLLDQRQTTERLRLQAQTDPAIGIPNRRVLIEWLQGLAQTRPRCPAALFLIDLDCFKQVNDQHGHLAGDVILRRVVERLQANLRPDDLLARFAGDELAVVLRNIEAPLALEIAERLRRAVAGEPFVDGDVNVPLSVSIGVALYPQHGSTPEELIARADEAMYVAKISGRNAVHGFGVGER